MLSVHRWDKMEKSCFGCKYLRVLDMDGDCWCFKYGKSIPDPVVMCEGNKGCDNYAENE